MKKLVRIPVTAPKKEQPKTKASEGEKVPVRVRVGIVKDLKRLKKERFAALVKRFEVESKLEAI